MVHRVFLADIVTTCSGAVQSIAWGIVVVNLLKALFGSSSFKILLYHIIWDNIVLILLSVICPVLNFRGSLQTCLVCFNPFLTLVDPSVHTDGFPYICQYCSKCFLLSFFQCQKCINISSKHTKSLCTSFCIPLQVPLSVLDTKVKLGMVEFKAFFFHTKSWFPWASLANPKLFLCVFHSLRVLILLRLTLHLLVFDFMAFHSSGSFSFDRPMIPSC